METLTVERIIDAKDGAVVVVKSGEDEEGHVTTHEVVKPVERTRLCRRCCGGGCRSCNGAGFYKREW